ncbi:MAG: winged helix-turn-helix domain-containing protein [Pirellulales bacterium]
MAPLIRRVLAGGAAKRQDGRTTMSAKKTTKTTAAKKPAPKKTTKAPARTKKPKAAGKMSALDAAAKVLADAGEPMNCKALIEAMAIKDYWTSPGGATPWATLYSAITREINEKGKDARFVKVERGQFAAKK